MSSQTFSVTEDSPSEWCSWLTNNSSNQKTAKGALNFWPTGRKNIYRKQKRQIFARCWLHLFRIQSKNHNYHFSYHEDWKEFSVKKNATLHWLTLWKNYDSLAFKFFAFGRSKLWGCLLVMRSHAIPFMSMQFPSWPCIAVHEPYMVHAWENYLCWKTSIIDKEMAEHFCKEQHFGDKKTGKLLIFQSFVRLIPECFYEFWSYRFKIFVIMVFLCSFINRSGISDSQESNKNQ